MGLAMMLPDVRHALAVGYGLPRHERSQRVLHVVHPRAPVQAVDHDEHPAPRGQRLAEAAQSHVRLVQVVDHARAQDVVEAALSEFCKTLSDSGQSRPSLRHNAAPLFVCNAGVPQNFVNCDGP